MQQLSEKTIISRLSDPATRHQTFSYVVDQYSQQLYWKIRGIVVFHDDADDVLQNTFLKAWKSLDDFQGKSKLYTWLYRIAVNEALDFLRRKKNQQALRPQRGSAARSGGYTACCAAHCVHHEVF